MNIWDRQALGQLRSRLVRPQHDIEQVMSPHLLIDQRELMSGADEEEDKIRLILKSLGRAQDRPEIMTAPHVARVSDNELARKTPLLPQDIVKGRQWSNALTVGPVVNHRDLLPRYPAGVNILGHSSTNCDIHRRAAHRSVAAPLEHPISDSRHGYAKPNSDLWIEVMQPVDTYCAGGGRSGRGYDREQWGIGGNDQHVAPPRESEQPKEHADVVSRIVAYPAKNPAAAETTGPNAMHRDSIDFRPVSEV